MLSGSKTRPEESGRGSLRGRATSVAADLFLRGNLGKRFGWIAVVKPGVKPAFERPDPYDSFLSE